jgi:VWFA-related protein
MLSHRHRWVCALLFFLSRIAFAGDTNDAPGATYRSTTSEVRVAFFTTDDHHRAVPAVRKDDFVIVDDGVVVRDFRSLARTDESALDVVVMVDASESVAKKLPLIMQDVVQLISQKQGPSDDNISVISFASLGTDVLCAHDCRTADAGRRLLSVRAAGATPLFDALQYGADLVSRCQTGDVRPVLILFSDGDDTISKTSPQQALQAVIASGALLYAVDLHQPGDGAGGSADLRHMAETTGGRYFSTPQDAANVLLTALEDLRASYVVTYKVPQRIAGFHTLRILPKRNQNLQFHCRSGYYYGSKIP